MVCFLILSDLSQFQLLRIIILLSLYMYLLLFYSLRVLCTGCSPRPEWQQVFSALEDFSKLQSFLADLICAKVWIISILSLIPRTLRNILADFIRAEVCIISILPLISSSSGFFSRLMESISRPLTYIWSRNLHVPQLFQLFSSLAGFRYFSVFSLSFLFIPWFAGTVRSTILFLFSST